MPTSGSNRKKATVDIERELRVIISRLNIGDKLPSIRVLMSKLDVTQSSLERVIGKLQNEGVINIRHKSGIYVSELALRKDLQLLFFQPDEDLSSNKIYGEIIRSLLFHAAMGGWRIKLIKAHSKEDLELLQHRWSDDHLTLTFAMNQQQYEFLHEKFGSSLLLAHLLPREDFGGPTLGSDHEGVMGHCLNTLRKMGHRRVAFMGKHVDGAGEWVVQRRLQIFEELARESGFKLEASYIQSYGECGMDAAVERLMESRFLPTGLILDESSEGHELYKALRKRDISPGGDMDVIGINHMVASAYMDPPLCTVGYQIDESIVAFLKHLRDLDGGQLPISKPFSLSFQYGESCERPPQG
jgi:DNA-binding LacI/PurR family transcriptional regulator